MSKPMVAVVGRPNVGKSTLFNKLAGERLSIVDDTPGVTRDRIFADSSWLDHRFTLIDTGGIEKKSDDFIVQHILEQVELAIDMADVTIMVVDARTGLTEADRDVALMLKKSRKPVVLCANKCDSIGDPPAEIYEFYALGLGDPIPVSSLHGHGTGDLLDAVCAGMPAADEEAESDDIKVAVIGRPNAGKSTLVNQIIGEQRMIVSDVPGTTRDTVDVRVENQFGRFLVIDTAGMRKRGSINEAIERYSVARSLAAVNKADVCVIMIDAAEGYTEQDSKIAGYAHEQGKACIIAVNKWDLVPKETGTMEAMRKKYESDFSFMSYAPILFISAKNNVRIDRLFETIARVDEQHAMRITTGMLNELLARATARVQPPTDKGRRLKIYYITQPSTRPPTFVVSVNRADLFHFSYKRYIENQIRETFGLEGTPIKMIVRERGVKDNSSRA